MSEDFRSSAKNAVNPYGDGNTVNETVSIIKDHLFQSNINLAKKFYDLTF